MMVGRAGSVLATHMPIRAWRVYAASLPYLIVDKLDDCGAEYIDDTRSINMTAIFVGAALNFCRRSLPKNRRS